MCTQQVDLTYLFCEKEVTENTLLCAGTQSCTQIKKDNLSEEGELFTHPHTRTTQGDSKCKRQLNQDCRCQDSPEESDLLLIRRCLALLL